VPCFVKIGDLVQKSKWHSLVMSQTNFFLIRKVGRLNIGPWCHHTVRLCVYSVSLLRQSVPQKKITVIVMRLSDYKSMK
jgi:hypothetical protein